MDEYKLTKSQTRPSFETSKTNDHSPRRRIWGAQHIHSMPSSFDCDTVPKLIQTGRVAGKDTPRAKGNGFGIVDCYAIDINILSDVLFVWSILTMESLPENWRATSVLSSHRTMCHKLLRDFLAPLKPKRPAVQRLQRWQFQKTPQSCRGMGRTHLHCGYLWIPGDSLVWWDLNGPWEHTEMNASTLTCGVILMTMHGLLEEGTSRIQSTLIQRLCYGAVLVKP